MMLWYLSFAGEEGFRGATVVKAADAEDALAVATERGLNPGGEAAILPVPSDQHDAPDVKNMRNRLIGKAEMIAFGGRRLADMPDDMQDQWDAMATKVCEDCNK